MIAVNLDSGQVLVRETAVPARPRGFALIQMLVAGICNTDIELQRGYYDFSGIPGHEFVGEVVESDDPNLIGKRVVGEINLACGRCDFCSIGLGRHCPNRTVLGIVKHPGAFAEYLTLPENNVHPIPDEIPSEQAAVEYEDRQQIMATFGEAPPEAISAFLEKRPAEFED